MVTGLVWLRIKVVTGFKVIIKIRCLRIKTVTGLRWLQKLGGYAI